MGQCSGRCECHAADWAALDQAAGINNTHSERRGRTRTNPDGQAFRRDLAAHYYAEWDLNNRDPEHRPTKTAVAENKFLYSERTLRRNLQRYQAAWPPGEEDAFPSWREHIRDLFGSATGTAKTWALLSRLHFEAA